ncbi:MAG: queuosine precursor transporter [SAR202 cluster bacterium]|nr:queuosine precursor transporter [SAR202 cluster bacterium]MQG39277.1 queuosine precursor transporter [SAR202 cluster bacterium]|tara:strand:+ start:2431 stop:3042 length:612 start_codon:yes stop_codon:yes gene_type:complete
MYLISLSVIFTTLLLTANISAVKIIAIGTEGIDAGIIAYPLTFLISDVLSEIYGRKITTKIIWLGFISNLLMISILFLVGIIPEASYWNDQESYNKILGSVPRIIFASMIAYLISQHHDVFAFEMWKNITKQRFLWIRNNASTIVSQGIDTTIFVLLAFIGTYSTNEIWNMIWITYLIKVAIAIIDTPLVYILVNFIKSKNNS